MTTQEKKRYDFLVGELSKVRTLTEHDLGWLESLVTKAVFMDLRCDFALKHILYNKEVLIMLIRDLLGEDVVDLDDTSRLPNEIDRFFAGDKNATMDVVAVTRDKRRIIIEIQQKKLDDFSNRILYYAAGMLYTQIQKGEQYDELKQVYVICFLDYEFPHGGDGFVSRYAMRELERNERLSDLLNVHFYELPRLHKRSMEGLTPIEGWLYLLKNLHKFADKPEGMDQRFEKVIDMARFHYLPDEEQLNYARAMISEYEKKNIEQGSYKLGVEWGKIYGREEGLAEGRKEGRVEGEAKGREDVARKLREMGMNPEDILKATGVAL